MWEYLVTAGIFALDQEHKEVKDLSEEQKTVLRRIQNEPESILPKE